MAAFDSTGPAALGMVLASFAGTAASHPHVFVETRVEIIVADGRVAAVRLDWTYDDFFSYVLTSDLGLDPDGDTLLSPAELTVLSEYVLDWPADFGGDLTVLSDHVPLALGPPEEQELVFEGGRVRERHLRRLLAPAGGEIVLQNYDPFYYTAYDVVGDIAVTDPACAAVRTDADLDAAYAEVDALLNGRAAADVGPDEAFPEVGHVFADTVVIRCGG